MILEHRATVILLDPESPEEREWLADQREGTWFEGALIVAPERVSPLAGQARVAGYPLRDENRARPWLPATRGRSTDEAVPQGSM